MRVREGRGQHELLECDKMGAEGGWGVGGMSRSGEEGDEVVEEEYVDVASWQREFDKMLRKERASYASGRLQVSVFVAAVACSVAALLQLHTERASYASGRLQVSVFVAAVACSVAALLQLRTERASYASGRLRVRKAAYTSSLRPHTRVA